MRKWRVITFKTKDFDDIERIVKKQKFKLQIYRPMITASVCRKGVVNVIERPLLFNYMFWKMDFDKVDLDEMRRHFKFRILRSGCKGKGPYVQVSGKEIARVKRMVGSQDKKYEKIRTSISYLKKMIGEKVIVRDGVFSGMLGVVKDVRKAGHVMVELMIFSRPILVDISVEYIERDSS